jgi:hypothetical protein
MFTSSKTNQDYVKFFKSLKKLAILLNIRLSTEYMCKDASKSVTMVNARYSIYVLYLCVGFILNQM